MELQDTTKEIKFFELTGKYLAKIVKIVDGDTVNVVIDLPGFGFRQFKVRLYGINTPELRPPKSDPNREEIKARAREAKEALASQVDEKIVTLDCYGWGKYGRLLADIHLNEGDGLSLFINKWLVEQGYAKVY